MIGRVDEELRMTESELQTEVAHTNILNSNESMAEANSVRSLTALAFIWIPFSAVFETYIQELTSSRVPSLWSFSSLLYLSPAPWCWQRGFIGDSVSGLRSSYGFFYNG